MAAGELLEGSCADVTEKEKAGQMRRRADSRYCMFLASLGYPRWNNVGVPT